MSLWSLYVKESGIFTGGKICCGENDLNANVPDGQSCVLGSHDHLSQRVDLETGLVVDYIPPQPSANHVWNTTTLRWDYQRTEADYAAAARSYRDKLLADCDWVTSRAMETGEPIPDVWTAYRTALRNISQQPEFPHPVWPTKPER